MLDQIHRLNHDAFRIDGDVTIYTDPFHIDSDQPKADIVLISHDHYDHCSVEDLMKIATSDTALVAIAACEPQLARVPGSTTVVKPGDRIEVKGVPIEVVPAYNTNKAFHPREAGHVGYVFTVGETRIYFAGDTDYIPEMAEIKADIALLPVSGTYVMTAEEAVKAAAAIGASVVVPMHYGDIVGTEKDARQFASHHSGKTIIK